MSEATLRALVEHHRATGAAATLLTAEVGDPAGYGRVVREGGRPVAIVEHRDATAAQKEQGEYYLTDVVALLSKDGAPVEALAAPHPEECMGINDRKQLAEVAAT